MPLLAPHEGEEAGAGVAEPRPGREWTRAGGVARAGLLPVCSLPRGELRWAVSRLMRPGPGAHGGLFGHLQSVGCPPVRPRAFADHPALSVQTRRGRLHPEGPCCPPGVGPGGPAGARGAGRQGHVCGRVRSTCVDVCGARVWMCAGHARTTASGRSTPARALGRGSRASASLAASSRPGRLHGVARWPRPGVPSTREAPALSSCPPELHGCGGVAEGVEGVAAAALGVLAWAPSSSRGVNDPSGGRGSCPGPGGRQAAVQPGAGVAPGAGARGV